MRGGRHLGGHQGTLTGPEHSVDNGDHRATCAAVGGPKGVTGPVGPLPVRGVVTIADCLAVRFTDE